MGILTKWTYLKDGKKWMAENLNYETDDSWCYDDKYANCQKYGRLYTWLDAKRICPAGWRLPSDSEWKTMTKFYGNYYNDSRYIAGYMPLIKGSEFSVLVGSEYHNLGTQGSYWTSTESNTSFAWYFKFYQGNMILYRDSSDKFSGHSCRCIQD